MRAVTKVKLDIFIYNLKILPDKKTKKFALYMIKHV